MSNPVIKVENLRKKYVITHQSIGRSKHSTLRDAIVDGIKSIAKHFDNRSSTTTASHENFWALNDISFEIKQGDRVGFLGRNGAGKSTLLKILSRITEPTFGRITIEGRVASLLEVGTGFHRELTGRENIYLNGAILGMSKFEIQRKFDEIVSFSGVEKFLDTPVKHYSSGMYVRLAFAVAAHLEPEILIVDEVLAVGDQEFQQKCLGKMQEVSDSGRTILFVSHNIQAIQNLCSKTVVLERGKMKFYGSVEQGVDQYLESLISDKNYNFYENPGNKPSFAYINQCKVLSSAGEFSAIGYPIGAQLIFDIEVIFNQTVYSPLLGIGINNSTNTRIVTLHTDYSSCINTSYPKGKYRFICKMNDLYLKPGTYNIKLHLNVKDCEDEMDPALLLRIVEKDNNKYKHIHNGVILTNQEWEIKEVTSLV